MKDYIDKNMHRRPGIAGLKQRTETQQRYAQLGEQIITQEEEDLELFRNNLVEFASKHKNKINKNPLFRAQFNRLCRKVGVDPLASRKGFWTELLGIGDFYYELGIQIIDICTEKQKVYGGLIPLKELTQRQQQRRKVAQKLLYKDTVQISTHDVKKAINKLQVFGPGFRIISVDGVSMVVTIPVELEVDHIILLDLAKKCRKDIPKYSLTTKFVQEQQKWDPQRIKRVLENLVLEGLVWVDEKASTRTYFILSLWMEQYREGDSVIENDIEDSDDGVALDSISNS